MPLLSPSPPHLVLASVPFSFLPPLSNVLHDFPHSLSPFFHALWMPIEDVAPALALSALFFSSTLYTESITMSKYPRGYKAYRERVAMFGVVLRTWEKGLVLAWKGRKAEVESLVWGSGEKVEKKE